MRTLLLAGLVTVAGIGAAKATVLTYALNLTPPLPPSEVFYSNPPLPAFNPSLGTLDSVTYHLEGVVAGTNSAYIEVGVNGVDYFGINSPNTVSGQFSYDAIISDPTELFFYKGSGTARTLADVVLGKDAVTFSSASTFTYTYTPAAVTTPVPEPATLALLGMGVAGVAAARRRRAG